MVDEVWALSEFNRASIASVTDKPVFTVPLPILAPTVAPGLDRASFGLPDGLMFLFCFDLLSIFERKNPVGLVDAFQPAFSPGDGSLLVLKIINGDRGSTMSSESDGLVELDRTSSSSMITWDTANSVPSWHWRIATCRSTAARVWD